MRIAILRIRDGVHLWRLDIFFRHFVEDSGSRGSNCFPHQLLDLHHSSQISDAFHAGKQQPEAKDPHLHNNIVGSNFSFSASCWLHRDSLLPERSFVRSKHGDILPSSLIFPHRGRVVDRGHPNEQHSNGGGYFRGGDDNASGLADEHNPHQHALLLHHHPRSHHAPQSHLLQHTYCRTKGKFAIKLNWYLAQRKS